MTFQELSERGLKIIKDVEEYSEYEVSYNNHYVGSNNIEDMEEHEVNCELIMGEETSTPRYEIYDDSRDVSVVTGLSFEELKDCIKNLQTN